MVRGGGNIRFFFSREVQNTRFQEAEASRQELHLKGTLKVGGGYAHYHWGQKASLPEPGLVSSQPDHSGFPFLASLG